MVIMIIVQCGKVAHIYVVFYEWWKTPEYQIPFIDETSKKEFESKIDTDTSWIYKRLKWLKKDKKLSLEQLHWLLRKIQ